MVSFVCEWCGDSGGGGDGDNDDGDGVNDGGDGDGFNDGGGVMVTMMVAVMVRGLSEARIYNV